MGFIVAHMTRYQCGGRGTGRNCNKRGVRVDDMTVFREKLRMVAAPDAIVS